MDGLMNKIFLILLIALTPAFISRGFSQSPSPGILVFEDPKQSFSFVKEGEILNFEYKFKNTGSSPVIITETKVACTCTTVDYPKEPILPGQSGVIKVKFDTKNKFDRQDRSVLIISNGKGAPQELRFKGVVQKNKAKE